MFVEGYVATVHHDVVGEIRDRKPDRALITLPVGPHGHECGAAKRHVDLLRQDRQREIGGLLLCYQPVGEQIAASAEQVLHLDTDFVDTRRHLKRHVLVGIGIFDDIQVRQLVANADLASCSKCFVFPVKER